mmetsp:Transcript_59990/g.68232  ORF Transcript_59990/g.68232 Transcript_59990/m.68232 type:complete len:218 (-) Transcript_59990:228-881(-)
MLSILANRVLVKSIMDKSILVMVVNRRLLDKEDMWHLDCLDMVTMVALGMVGILPSNCVSVCLEYDTFNLQHMVVAVHMLCALFFLCYPIPRHGTILSEYVCVCVCTKRKKKKNLAPSLFFVSFVSAIFFLFCFPLLRCLRTQVKDDKTFGVDSKMLSTLFVFFLFSMAEKECSLLQSYFSPFPPSFVFLFPLFLPTFIAKAEKLQDIFLIFISECA